MARGLRGQGSKWRTIRSVRPQHMTAWFAAPRADIASPHSRPGPWLFLVEQEQVVGAGFYAELRDPAVANNGKLILQSSQQLLGARSQDPWTGALEVALRHGWCARFGTERGCDHFRSSGIGFGCHQRHRIDDCSERLSRRVR